MLVDFGIMKEALRKIIGELDHTSLNDNPAFSDGCPSAKRIARFIHDKMHAEMPQTNLSLVEVFETDRNRATYSPTELQAAPTAMGGLDFCAIPSSPSSSSPTSGTSAPCCRSCTVFARLSSAGIPNGFLDPFPVRARWRGLPV